MRGAVLVAFLLVGCGGMTYEEFVTARIDAECGYLVRCRAVTTVADCRAHFDRVSVESPNTAAALAADKLTFDEDAASACIEAFESLSCDTTAQAEGALEACSEVITGTLDEGAPCGFDLECETNHCTMAPCAAACCLGVCAPLSPQPGPGDPCSVTCDESSFCGSESICEPYLTEGAPCEATKPCGAGLFCAGQAIGNGICAPLPHLGEPCEGPCAEVSAICVDQQCIEAGRAGDGCTNDFHCSAYYTCNEDQTCGRYPGLGMRCSGRCADGAYCLQGTCAPQKAVATMCMYNDECETHVCDGGLCAEPTLCI